MNRVRHSAHLGLGAQLTYKATTRPQLSAAKRLWHETCSHKAGRFV